MEQTSRLAAAPPAVDPSRTSLFLDFDGTLVDLADRPDGVTVSVDLKTLLDRLERRFEGRLAVVSGRSVAQLKDYLGPLGEIVALVGSHGAEVQTPGSPIVAPKSPRALREAEQQFSAAFRDDHRIVIEVKSLGVAIHYRLHPSAEDAAVGLAADFAASHGLELQKGKMMVEVRTAGHDKGSGIATLMAKPPFEGTVPVFLGDDLTDEPGFRRCAEMGGAGILVGVGRPTVAQFHLPDVAAVHGWLAAQ